MNPSPPPRRESAEEAPIPDLGRFEKTIYGVGSGGYQLAANGVNFLANPVYNILLGLSPTLIGVVLMISRLFDAITDPIVGKISDDTRTRWGRRKPFIFVGSFLSAFAFVNIWMVREGWSDSCIFLYYLGAMLLFYFCNTILVVPYHTLGLEMTADYNERTVISGYKMCFSYIFILILPWVFRLAQAQMFNDTLSGIRILSYAMAGIVIVAGILPAIFVKERYYRLASQQRKMKFWSSAKLTFQNRSFVLLTIFIVLAGPCEGIVSSLGPYIVFYHMYEGDLKEGASMVAIIANIGSILSLASIPVVIWLANRLGKITVLKMVMILGLIGELLKFVLYSREYHWLAPLSQIFFAPQSAGLWVLTNSMNADICDEDELNHGLRREGMFGSVGNWVVKMAASVAVLLSGVILDLSGFRIDLGIHQSPQSLLTMRILFCVMPIVFVVSAIFVISRFPLTKDRMTEIRQELEQRRSTI